MPADHQIVGRSLQIVVHWWALVVKPWRLYFGVEIKIIIDGDDDDDGVGGE